jgi:hypothetical protein
MKNSLKIIVLIFAHQFLLGQELKKEYQNHIVTFINFVKNNQKEKLADLISYPLKREYPITNIRNKKEFIKRYDEIFDVILKNIIVKSNPAKDWSEVGWRGIMLNRGDIWMDTDGKIIAINYQSKLEKEIKEGKVKIEKSTLHPSLANYNEPVCIIETSKFRVRIDDMGKQNYRYASWAITKKMSEKPDLIITNGKFIAEGTGGNHRYEFKKSSYVYEISIIVLGEKETPPAMLKIYKDEKEVLLQNAKIIDK